MALNPFGTVGSYPQMLRKIATFTFFLALLALSFVRTQVPVIDEFLKPYSVKMPVGGISLPLGTILPALLVALLFRVFKLHDRVSDLFQIRQRFDVEHILKPMARQVGVDLSKVAELKIRQERRRLMREVFYKYASGTTGAAVIDSHYITLALDQWCWFWIVLEAQVLATLTALVLMLAKEAIAGSLILISVLLGIGLLKSILRACSRYAHDEIDQILDNDQRKHEIARVFHALQGQGT